MKNSSQNTNPIKPDRMETSLAKRKAEKMHIQPISTNSNSTSCSSTNAQVLPPNGLFPLFIIHFVYFLTQNSYHTQTDIFRRIFSPAEILLLEDMNTSQWFKAFIVIRRLCLFDENVLSFVR